MNETSAFRRVAAVLTIGSFSIAALMGIVALLAGGSFGEGEGRILLTTLIVGCASICMLCYLGTADSRWAPVGLLGAAVLILPVASALILTWSDWDGDSTGLWKTFGVGVVAALTLAQICLLLAVAAGRDRARVVLWPTIGLASVLALLIIGLILGESEADDVWRLIGVIAILDVLGTLVTIAIAKFGGRGDADPQTPRSEGLRITLTGDRAAAIVELSRTAGRSPSELVGAAVDAYLRAEI